MGRAPLRQGRVRVQADLRPGLPQPPQHGFLPARQQRKARKQYGAAFCGAEQDRDVCGVCSHAGRIQARRSPASGPQFRRIGLADAPQCAQQGRSRCGHLLLHVGQIHGRHLLLEHVFKNLGQAQAPGQKAAYVHMGEARGQGAVFLGNGSHSLLQCRHTVQVARRVQRGLSQARPPLGRQIREGQNARQGPHMAGSRIKPRQVAPGPVVGHHHQGLARHIAAEPVQVGLEVRQKGMLPGKNQKGRAAHAKASSGGNRPSQCSCKGETTVSVTRRKRRRSR